MSASIQVLNLYDNENFSKRNEKSINSLFTMRFRRKQATLHSHVGAWYVNAIGALNPITIFRLFRRSVLVRKVEGGRVIWVELVCWVFALCWNKERLYFLYTEALLRFLPKGWLHIIALGLHPRWHERKHLRMERTNLPFLPERNVALAKVPMCLKFLGHNIASNDRVQVTQNIQIYL